MYEIQLFFDIVHTESNKVTGKMQIDAVLCFIVLSINTCRVTMSHILAKNRPTQASMHLAAANFSIVGREQRWWSTMAAEMGGPSERRAFSVFGVNIQRQKLSVTTTQFHLLRNKCSRCRFQWERSFTGCMWPPPGRSLPVLKCFVQPSGSYTGQGGSGAALCPRQQGGCWGTLVVRSTLD